METQERGPWLGIPEPDFLLLICVLWMLPWVGDGEGRVRGDGVGGMGGVGGWWCIELGDQVGMCVVPQTAEAASLALQW